MDDGQQVKITVEGLSLGTPVWASDGDAISLGEMVARAIAMDLVGGYSTAEVREQIGEVRQAEIERQVAVQVATALEGPAGGVPVTLADVIVAEARAQIEQDPDRYKGISTPLAQVVAAEVYAQLHAEATALITQARTRIRSTLAEEMRKLVERQFGVHDIGP